MNRLDEAAVRARWRRLLGQLVPADAPADLWRPVAARQGRARPALRTWAMRCPGCTVEAQVLSMRKPVLWCEDCDQRMEGQCLSAR